MDERLERPREMIPVAPLREAFQRSHMSAREIAGILDWTQDKDGQPYPDSIKVLRACGATAANTKYKKRQQRVRAEVALQLGEVLGLDPHEMGL